MKRLTLKQYRNMVNEVVEYNRLNGEMPLYIMVEDYKILKSVYIDMIDRVNKFILEMGRNPRTVDIQSPVDNFELQ